MQQHEYKTTINESTIDVLNMLSSGAADAKRVLDGEQARYYQPVLWDGMLPTTLCQVFTSELAAIRHALKVVANAGVSGYRITTVELTKKEAGV